MSDEIKAGVIGLGAMGESMARHLAEAGLLVSVWNRTESKAIALAAKSTSSEKSGYLRIAIACYRIHGSGRRVLSMGKP